MLYLNRKEREVVVVGDDTTITVAVIKKGEVILRIATPDQVRNVTLREYERFKINQSVGVMARSIRSASVRLGVEAERSISVHRKEVYDKIQEELAA